MINQTLSLYTVQTHVHGSGGHGRGSHLGYDFIAAREGVEDVVWWNEHEFRVANFAKITGHDFDTLCETMRTPNRDINSPETWSAIELRWEKAAGTEAAQAVICRDNYLQGTGSLKLSLSEPGECVYQLNTDNHRHKMPVFTYPTVTISIFAGSNFSPGDEAFIRFGLGQKLPDFNPAVLTYTLAGDTGILRGKNGVEIRRKIEPGRWHQLVCDVGADVIQYKVPGGLDHCLHDIQIGIRGRNATSACFDALRVEARINGNDALAAERDLVASLPLKLTHHVGVEYSYYGQHINCFGSSVPLIAYESSLPERWNSTRIVQHIHRHGGLAGINHLVVDDDMEKTVAEMVECNLHDADFLEINRKGGFLRKILFWNRLHEAGMMVTAITGSDSHAISEARAGGQREPGEWVNCLWARSDSEADLLESLGRGNLFLADPLNFRGKIHLSGPAESLMGDLLVAPPGPKVKLEAAIEGAEPGDLLLWLINGSRFHETRLRKPDIKELVTLPLAPTDVPRAIRIQLVRPGLADNPSNGTIAVSNPIYLSGRELPTRHRKRYLPDSRE